MGIASDIGLDNVGIDFSGMGQRISSFVMNAIYFLVFAAIVGLIVYYFYDKKTYNKKIQIFEEINGRAVPTRQYKAREMNIPNTSIKILRIKENKMFLPYPTIQTGSNNYLFFIRDDLEWINIGITNLNKKLTELDIRYNHVDMRYANSSLKELIKENYGQTDWLKKYGVYVALGIFVLIAGIALYLVADKLNETVSILDKTMLRNEK